MVGAASLMDSSISLRLLVHPAALSASTPIFLALVLASLAMWPRVVGELAGVSWPHRRRDVALGGALFLLAFALRWALATHTLIHENHHGYHHVSSFSVVNESAESHGVSSSHILLLRLFGAVVGVSDESTFLFDALLSSAAVVGLAVVAAQATGTRAGAWAAGALLALQPLSIVLGPTEEFLVSASGLCLVGMALLHAGASHGLRTTLALGVALLCLGAGSREITLPLATLALPALLSARTRDGAVPWRAALAVCGAMTVLLLPQAVLVLFAWHRQAATRGTFGAPSFPWVVGPFGRNQHWVGWFEPFIPRWQAWAMMLAPVLLAIWCAARRDARLAVGALLPAVIGMLLGGILGSGWFPTHLRHQLFSMALLLLPIAACVALLARALGPRRGALAPAAVALLAAVSLARRPLGYRPALALTAEYHFFRGALAAAPRDAAVVTFEDDPLTHLPWSWLRVQRPQWMQVRAGALPALPPDSGRRPVYLLLDRSCFVDPSSFPAAPLPAGTAAPAAVATPYGRMHSQCARALGAAPWREVATRRLARPHPPMFEMPSLDAEVRLAVLRWDQP